MDLLPLMKERYSVRRYAQIPVEEEKLRLVLEAARLAPTARNLQPFHIYVVESGENLEKLRSLTPCTFNAPVVLMFCGVEKESAQSPLDGRSWAQMDTTIALTHAVLEAQSLGLGTCIVGWYDKDAVHDAFNLPEEEAVWALLPMGYAAEDALPSGAHETRKPMETLVTRL